MARADRALRRFLFSGSVNEFQSKAIVAFIVVSVRTGVVGGVEKYTRNERRVRGIGLTPSDGSSKEDV